MRGFIPFFFLLITFTTTANAQGDRPSWLDPYQRQARYPAESYLTGMSAELVGKKQSLTDIYSQLNLLSRNQIIESIRVDVKAETEMNISVVNTEATQMLDQRSVSTAEAELVGLKFENYYDKKKKQAFSFSYVSIDELIRYHIDIINVSTAEIDKNTALAKATLEAANKERAIDLLYTSQLELNKINESALVILAMDQDHLLDFPKIRQMKLAIETITNDIFTSGALAISELASYIAYQLQLQLSDDPGVVCLGNIAYGDSGKESDFSIEVKNKTLNTLVELATLKRGTSSCTYTLQGTFSTANENVTITGNLVDKAGKAVAGISTKVSEEVLHLGEVSFLPKNFNYIKELSSIKLSSNQREYVISKVDLFNYPVEVTVEKDGELLPDIPILFVVMRDDQVELEKSIATDKYGKVALLLNSEELKLSGNFVLTAIVDVSSLLDIASSSAFYKKVMQDQPPYRLEAKLKIIAPTVFVNSSELSLGEPKIIPVLAPSVKKELAALDYQFVDSEVEADYLVQINSATRRGQSSGIAHFSYLDATVSMRDQKTDKEIYKYSVSNIKGGGADYNTADAKAYEKAKKLIANDLSYKLEFGN